jgi:hypothetical protein
MLKFDDANASEDANALPKMIFADVSNSKPSGERLHQTKST